MKTVAGLRKTKYRGLDKVGLDVYLLAAAAYNLIRLPKLDDGLPGLMARKQVPAFMALAFKGRWRIVAMDLWDKDAIDLVERRALSHSTARKARCDPSPCARLARSFATAAVDGVPIAEFLPGRASTRADQQVLDGVGLPQRTRAAFLTAISSSTMVTIQASPASPR